MTAMMSIIEELSEQMQDGEGVDVGQGALLRSVLGARARHEARQEHRDEMIDMLFRMSGTAWAEVLFERVKAQIEQSQGDQLDKLAKLIAVSGATRFNRVVEKLGGREELKAQIFQNFVEKRR